MSYISYQGKLLVSSIRLDQDDFFNSSVVFVGFYNQDGAFGLIINKPANTSIQKACLQESNLHTEYPVGIGGPMMQDALFCLYKKDNKIITSPLNDEHQQYINDNPACQCILLLGCSSWTENQLDQEIVENSWLVAQARDEILFDLPFDQRYHRVLKPSIQLDKMQPDIGYA